MKEKRPISHYILFAILALIIVVGIYTTVELTNKVKEMARTVNLNMINTMDPKAPDPGKTKPEKYEVGPNTKKVKIGAYLERIEDLDIKQSSWTYEFYLWFSWKPSETDFIGKLDKTHNDELPFSIINGDIIKANVIDEVYDTKKDIAYLQYFVKAKNSSTLA
jgi:hypothetical protein